MEVGPAFHRVMHHLNHASTACQKSSRLSPWQYAANQAYSHTCANTHTHTLTMLCYTAFLLKMSSPIQDRLQASLSLLRLPSQVQHSGGVNNRNSFLCDSGGERSESKVSVGLISSEVSLLGLWGGLLLPAYLHPDNFLTCPVRLRLILMTSFYPNFLLEDPISKNAAILRCLGLQHLTFGGQSGRGTQFSSQKSPTGFSLFLSLSKWDHFRDQRPDYIF